MPDLSHPGSFVGDSVEEFKKLPTWGKIAAVGVLVVVAYLAWRAHAASSSAQTAAGSTAGSAGAATAGTQSPFPMIGSLPLLPSNVNPVYDPNGNPIAYQQNPTPPPGSPTTPPPTAPKWTNPLIPSGQYKGPSFSNLKPGTWYNYQGTNYLLNTGPGGKLYGTPKGGQQVLLYGPPSMYKGGQGSGGMSTFSFMDNPMIYLVSAHPHAPATVPQR
jgi:hypothetical protein